MTDFPELKNEVKQVDKVIRCEKLQNSDQGLKRYFNSNIIVDLKTIDRLYETQRCKALNLAAPVFDEDKPDLEQEDTYNVKPQIVEVELFSKFPMEKTIDTEE